MKPLLVLITVIMSGVAATSAGNPSLPRPLSDSAKPVFHIREVVDASGMMFCSNNMLVSLHQLLSQGTSVHANAGYTKQGRPIDVFYFPGATDQRALVIGGMHGSELSSVEVARTLINQLNQGEQLHYSVMVIPSLFPDNAALALSNPLQIGGVSNTGRYTSNNAPDPNRQMPALGKPFDPGQPVDFMGREIEKENQLLLQMIQAFRPSRILNIHAIRNVNQAGVYADPRTDHKGIAQGFESDSSLALAIANNIYIHGGLAKGNRLDSLPTARYQNDPCPAPCGHIQKRNLQGSVLPNKRGHGVSLGGWATTAVADDANPSNSRNAMRLITMEFPGYCRPVDLQDEAQRMQCALMIGIYARAIKEVFLGNYFTEGSPDSTNPVVVNTF